MPARTVDPIYIPLRVPTAAGTLQATPQVVTADLPHGILEAVDLTIPPGHAGMTGFALRLAATTILPFTNPGQFIVGDDLQETFVLGVEVDTGVRIATYNTGQFPHAHYLRFRIRQNMTATGVPTATLVPTAALNAT